MMSRIGEILSDEESVKQLSELAQMFMSETSGEKGGGKAEDGEKHTGDVPDISQIMKISGLAGALSQKDSNAELLLALRPHLREERRKRVDKAIKLLRLMAVWDAAKESGLLNELL